MSTSVSTGTGTLFQAQATASAASGAPAPLKDLRTAGAAAFARLGFPSTRSEDWAYTNVSSIAEGNFVAAADRAASVTTDASHLEAFSFGSAWPMLVFLNGRFTPSLSSHEALPDGVRVMTLAQAALDEPELLQRYLGSAAPADRDGFTALNAAFAGEGTLIHVAKEMVTETPVHLLHVTDASGDGVMSHPRHVIIVERHAKASVIESYVALDDATYFTNTVTEVILEDGATLHHSRVQRESLSAFHIGTIEARQGRDSHFVQFSFQTGAQLSR